MQIEPTLSHLRLVRVDVARHMDRYYEITVQPDLFGGTRLIREWGRRGRAGQIMQVHFDDAHSALDALHKLATAKCRRGYRITPVAEAHSTAQI